MANRRTRARAGASRAGRATAQGFGFGRPTIRPGVDGVTQLKNYQARRQLTYGVAALAGTAVARSAYRKGKAEYNRRRKRKKAYRRRRDSNGKFA
jgi:hypothetical protein